MNKIENIPDDVSQNIIIRTITDLTNKQTEILKNEIRDIKKRINRDKEQIQGEIYKLKEKYEYLEKSLKKNNIIIFGLEVTDNNLLKYTLNIFKSHLKIDITENDISDIYSIGKNKDKRPVVVKFVSFLKKKQVLNNARGLKGTNIVISEDLTVEERVRNKILRKHLQIAREKKLNAYIKNNRLYINGDVYNAEQLEGKEGENNEIIIPKQLSNSAPPTPTIRKAIAETIPSPTEERNSTEEQSSTNISTFTPIKLRDIHEENATQSTDKPRKLRSASASESMQTRPLVADRSGSVKKQIAATKSGKENK